MSAPQKSVGLALLGTGTVGGGVFDLLEDNRKLIAERTNINLSIVSVASRNMARAQARINNSAPVFADWQTAIEHPDCQIVVELMGGVDVAHDCALACLRAGKPYVTANKALLALHGTELFAQAQQSSVGIYYEAAVAGCIPAIRTLRDSLAGDRVNSILGIVNGTCNYILSKMADEGVDFNQALQSATDLGYAEADPTLDIDGLDAAHKAVIMAWLAFGTPLSMANVPVTGIRDTSPADEVCAAEFGYTIKQIATMRDYGIDGVLVRVAPALVARDHNLAKIADNLNAVLVNATAAGELLLVGAGAGAQPTASAVLSDVIEAARAHLAQLQFSPPLVNGSQLLPPEHLYEQSYLRLSVLDNEGVVVKFSTILAQAGISIEALYQAESQTGQPTNIAMLLHETRWDKLTAAVKLLSKLDEIIAPPVLMPIAIPHHK